MRTNYFRTILTAVVAALLCAATFLSSHAPASALAETKKPTQGQDVGDKNCERIDGPESSTFGKCKSVCKDRNVTWDAVGRRYVCDATKQAGSRPAGVRAPISDAVFEQSDKPARRQSVAPKSVKAKKN